MTWTAEDRHRYAPAVQDIMRAGMLTRLAATLDAIDPPAMTGRPRTWSSLLMLQALWFMCRFGVPWRSLPESFPPRQSVATRLQRWHRLGVLDRALVVVNTCLRLALGRRRRPSAAIVDTQTMKTGPQRGPRGFDAAKRTKGRKRVLMVDTDGNPLGVQVVPADVQDRDALVALAPDLARENSLLLMWLDRGFAGDGPKAFLAGYRVVTEIVGTKQRKGFAVEQRRWKVEQTFGCLQRYRRLRVDDEMSCGNSRTMTLLASLFMTGMRLERALSS